MRLAMNKDRGTARPEQAGGPNYASDTSKGVGLRPKIIPSAPRDAGAPWQTIDIYFSEAASSSLAKREAARESGFLLLSQSAASMICFWSGAEVDLSATRTL